MLVWRTKRDPFARVVTWYRRKRVAGVPTSDPAPTANQPPCMATLCANGMLKLVKRCQLSALRSYMWTDADLPRRVRVVSRPASITASKPSRKARSFPNQPLNDSEGGLISAVLRHSDPSCSQIDTCPESGISPDWSGAPTAMDVP